MILRRQKYLVIRNGTEPIGDIKSDNKHENINKSNANEERILLNPTQPTTSGYKRKFLWPDNFINRESRKETEPLEPIEPKDIGKLSTRPYFGQVIETLGPHLNSNEQKSCNFCFKLGRRGETVQVWSFGSELEMRNLDKIIQIELYTVYWGSYTTSSKISNNLNPTSDWIAKITPKTSCINKASLVMSKVKEGVQDQKTAKKQFLAKFQQATNTVVKKRMKEQTLEEKIKVRFDKDQKKITEFLNVKEDNLILNYKLMIN